MIRPEADIIMPEIKRSDLKQTYHEGSVRPVQSVSQLKQALVLSQVAKISLILVPGTAQDARY